MCQKAAQENTNKKYLQEGRTITHNIGVGYEAGIYPQIYTSIDLDTGTIVPNLPLPVHAHTHTHTHTHLV